ncbi:MAG: lipopolysaccharide biosynthesis protein [Candidatus Latescibacteria bacterium]|nr:lipopolysaccharide biosynthesis protein [Candidatus Latescibacterota bacterium]
MTLRTKALKATFWLGTGSALSQGISYGSTLLLAGLLSPDEIGKAAISLLVVSSAGLLHEMGIGRTLIYMKDRVEEAANTGFMLILLVSMALYAIVFALSSLIATFFRDPEIVTLVRVMALTLIINAFGEVPASLFEKRLEFDRKTVTEIGGLASYGILVVVLAYAGFSFWSIVYASLVSAAIRGTLTWWLSPWMPKLNFDPKIARDLLRYGSRIVESTVVNFGIRNLDNAIIGRMLGPATLGTYDLAYRIANIPATTVMPIIGKVMFPVYTQISDYTYDLRNAFLKALKFTSLLTIPASIEILLLAPGAMNAFYGHKWDSAIRPIQILTLYGVIRSLSSGQGGIFMALNRVRTMTKISGGQLVMLLIFLYPAARFYGVEGVCWVSTGAMAYSAITHYIMMRPLIGLRHSQIVQALWPGIVATALAAGLAYLLCLQVTHPGTRTFSLLQPCVAGAFYLPLIVALDHEVHSLLTDLRGRLRSFHKR